MSKYSLAFRCGHYVLTCQFEDETKYFPLIGMNIVQSLEFAAYIERTGSNMLSFVSHNQLLQSLKG